ncbi:MAG: hypothetical protein N2385_14630 [Chloroflexus sp.]|nr:hypothetical protein [Chloroflexus sp.]
MTTTIELWLPAHPAVFGIVLGVLIMYLVYAAAKFVISLWTGA